MHYVRIKYRRFRHTWSKHQPLQIFGAQDGKKGRNTFLSVSCFKPSRLWIWTGSTTSNLNQAQLSKLCIFSMPLLLKLRYGYEAFNIWDQKFCICWIICSWSVSTELDNPKIFSSLVLDWNLNSWAGLLTLPKKNWFNYASIISTYISM